MNPAGLDGPLSRAVSSAARFVADANPDNTALFDDALMTLLRALPGVDPTARLTLSSSLVSELLDYCPTILTANTTNASTRSKVHRLLFNISLYNIRLRRYLSGDLELCGPIFHCLKLSLKEQLGPQNMIDILRLLQVLSYERCLSLGLWTNELISFLMSEVNREDEMEWMPYCIAILCNLTCRSKSVCSRIKKSSTYKVFCRRVLKLLSHDSRIVVVSALVLIGYLEEKIRDVVYCSQNIRETFQCVFNVLVMGDRDCLMTRQIASDLLRRLVVSDAPTVSSVPVITSTGKDVASYSFFDSCIQRTSELIVTLDARFEETVKVYDLLLAFCTLPQLRSPVCSAIIRCPPTESRLTTPLLAIASTASMSSEKAIDPFIPIKAMKLLTLLCKELIDSNNRVSTYLPCDQVIPIIDFAVKSSVETSKENSVAQCQLIVEGLRLAEVCCQEEDLRSDLLSLITASLCAHVAEFQLMTNPIVVQMGKPPTMRTDTLPEWSIHGVSIVLELIRLLAALKDHSKPHKVQYWNSLKDERLVPFLAYAIAYGDHEMVHDALLLYTHCSQVQAFPSRWLGDLVASCAIAKRYQTEQAQVNSLNSSKEIKRCSPEQMDCSGIRSPDLDTSLQKENNRAIDELLHKLRNGYDIKDLKMSDMLTAYEKKISVMQARERELEQVVASSERLRLQMKNTGGTSETELARVRLLVADSETLKEANERLKGELETTRKVAEEQNARNIHQLRNVVSENDALKQRCDQLAADLTLSRQTAEEKERRMREDLSRMRQERDDLNADMLQERELVIQARRHADEQKKRLEIASGALVEKKKEIEELTKSLNHMKTDLVTLNRKYDQDIDRIRKENDALHNELDSLKSRGQKTQQDLEKMKKLREEMLRLAGGYE